MPHPILLLVPSSQAWQQDQEVGVRGLPTPTEDISIHVSGLLLVLTPSQDIALTGWGVQEGGTLPCSAASRASISWVEGTEPWGSSLSAASLASISACEGTDLGLFSWRSRARRSAMTWSWWVSPLLRGVLGFCLASKAAIRFL